MLKMDLLGSILGTMEKPPSASEKEKRIAEDCRKEREKAIRKEQRERAMFKKQSEKRIGDFIGDPKKTRLKLPSTNKVYRALLHEIAEANGLISQSFGTEEIDRHIVLFKKECPPSEEELQALRDGQEYVPSKDKQESRFTPTTIASTSSETSTKDPNPHHPQAPSYGGVSHYQNKYKHLLGGLDCAEKSAVKMEPNRTFGYVPSSNKRDLRSIEQTMNDMKSRKRPKLDPDNSEQETKEHLEQNNVSS